MKFTLEEQKYISTHKDKLEEVLLENLQFKVIEITSDVTFTAKQKLSKIAEATNSLPKVIEALENPSMEFDTLPVELSNMLKQLFSEEEAKELKETSQRFIEESTLKNTENEPQDSSVISPPKEQVSDEIELQELEEIFHNSPEYLRANYEFTESMLSASEELKDPEEEYVHEEELSNKLAIPRKSFKFTA